MLGTYGNKLKRTSNPKEVWLKTQKFANKARHGEHMLIILALGRPLQEAQRFKVSLGYIAKEVRCKNQIIFLKCKEYL